MLVSGDNRTLTLLGAVALRAEATVLRGIKGIKGQMVLVGKGIKETKDTKGIKVLMESSGLMAFRVLKEPREKQLIGAIRGTKDIRGIKETKDTKDTRGRQAKQLTGGIKGIRGTMVLRAIRGSRVRRLIEAIKDMWAPMAQMALRVQTEKMATRARMALRAQMALKGIKG